MLRKLFLLGFLLLSVGCGEAIVPGPTEANLARIKVGTSIEEVNRLLKISIPAHTLSAETQVTLDKPRPTKSGGTITQIPVRFDFANGKVTAVERAIVD